MGLHHVRYKTSYTHTITVCTLFKDRWIVVDISERDTQLQREEVWSVYIGRCYIAQWYSEYNNVMIV